jgi:hypothetical protein
VVPQNDVYHTIQTNESIKAIFAIRTIAESSRQNFFDGNI